MFQRCLFRSGLLKNANAININFCRKNETVNTEYIPVYKFPYIRTFSIINRLKFYHTVLAGFTVPVSIVLHHIDFVDLNGVLFTSVLGLSGCLTLYSLGYFCDKLIGFVYLHKNGKIVKVSYVDFWGRRKDENIPLDDIIPLSDLPLALTDQLYLKFVRYSTKKHLKLNLKYGQVLDKANFKKVFN